MSDLTKIFAENQKKILRLIAPSVKKHAIPQNVEDSDSETENTHPTSTSTPIKSKSTTCKTTSKSNSNMVTEVLNDSTNLISKKSEHQRSQQQKDRPTTSRLLFAPQPRTYPMNDPLPMPIAASLHVFDGKSKKSNYSKTCFETT